MITAKTLLAGPRGRRLLFEFAIISEQNTDSGTHALHEAMFWFSAKNAPASSFILSDTSNDKDPYSSIKSHQKSASVEAVISAMNQVPLAPVTSTRALGALADSVAHAMYWQEPDETDICLADSDMYAPLERIASHICDSKAIAWWSNPVDYNDQWEVRWVEDGQEVSGEPSSVSSQVLKQWEQSMQQWETTHNLIFPFLQISFPAVNGTPLPLFCYTSLRVQSLMLLLASIAKKMAGVSLKHVHTGLTLAHMRTKSSRFDLNRTGNIYARRILLRLPLVDGQSGYPLLVRIYHG